MVNIAVRVYATLRRYVPAMDDPEAALSMDLPAGSTVGDLVARLRIPPQEVKQVFVNYRAAPSDYVFQDGDRVGVFPLVAGG